MPIYKKFKQATLTQEQRDFLKQIRNIEKIQYYDNYVFSRDFLSEEYEIIEHVWSHGDKLYKLANKYFGDRNLFWIIGLFNNKPTDSHYSYGDVVYVPNNFIKFINDVVK
jgi:hypothetical protein